MDRTERFYKIDRLLRQHKHVPVGRFLDELDVSAPGYQTAHRSVVVTGSTPPCGCPRVDTQQIAVALAPSA